MFRVFRLKKDEKGQSLVEFALILPILLLLVLGIIQFGIVFSSQIAVTNAAREGARVAAVGGDADVVTRINNSIGGHIFINQPLTSGNINISPRVIGEEVTVSITGVTLNTFAPVPGVFDTNDVVLSGQASMRVETIPD